jgi:glycosyltransferase involved in cell wall biosynthesis
MRVLLSAYACEPGKGSEQEVGWQRALHMRAFADEVWVITRSNSKELIEADPMSEAPGLHFIYYDLPAWMLRLKKRSWFLYIYFALWQWGAFQMAVKCHREKPFDVVYHVTFVSMQFGCYMGRLQIPLVIGPIAGGERAPFRLRRGMPIRGRLNELMRDIGIVIQRYSPLTSPAYAAARRIFVATPDSLRLVPSKWQNKTSVHLAIGTRGRAARSEGQWPPDNPRFVFAGRLLHWKGVHFAIQALAEARRTVPAATLTLIGQGPAEWWLRDLANKNGVANAVEFTGHVPRQKLVDSLLSYTALVFPSLHDSGGLVVLEALSKGLPTVCLDLGGPGIMVDESCGIVIPTFNSDEDETITGIANAMIALATMSSAELERLSTGAIARANELSWANLTERIADSEMQETR